MTGNLPYQDGSQPASRSHNCDDLHEPALLQHRPQSCPKLGDFALLRTAAMDFHPPHHILSRQLPSKRSTRLGDLSKVVDQLRCLQSAPDPLDANLAFDADSYWQSCKSARLVSVSDSEAQMPSRSKKPAPTLNPTVIPSQMTDEKPYASTEASLPRPLPASVHRTSQIHSQRQTHRASHFARLLTYELSDKALVVPIFDAVRTAEAAHHSLTCNLIPYCTADRHLTRKYPSNSSYGVHVFLDMSNIEISFQKALKKRYGVADSARFSPLPRLNLPFLTELLVRRRSSRGLHVSCSILPGRKEPKYVQALRDLGYQVDVRERKRVDSPGLNTCQTKSSCATGVKSISRYVEDLVDETLHTRIAEAVMEYFQEQGTIVLATGDAKPAQYSDGFFRYVDRALRMGWNVELVAWQGSLSSSWRDIHWTATWGERFRIIELDGFLDDLLDVQL